MQISRFPGMAIQNAAASKVEFSGRHHHRRPSNPVQGTLDVSGVGHVSKNPDIMTMQISVQETGDNRDTVARAVNAKAETIITKIKSLDLPLELKSSQSVQPVREWNGKRHIMKGYQGSFSLQVREKNAKAEQFPDHAAQVANIAIEADADFDGPHYALSERRAQAAAREALSSAYADALKQAQKIAKTGGFALAKEPAGVVIGNPNNDNFNRGHQEMAFAAMDGGGRMAKSAAVSSSSFEFAPITVSSPQVSLRFNIIEAANQPEGPAEDDTPPKKFDRHV